MKLDGKLNSCFRLLIPLEVRDKLDIDEHEPYILEFNEETKEITVNFKKYIKELPIKLPNPITIEPLESIPINLHIRKRNLVTVPNRVFKELNLSGKKYNVMFVSGLDVSSITLSLVEYGAYKYRQESVLSFSDINNYFNINIHEGLTCSFKYKSDGTLIFTFKSTEIKDKKLEEEIHRLISPEERLNELNHKFESEGLCKEEFDELNKICKQLEPPIKTEPLKADSDLLEELEPEVQHEIEEYRKQLPKFKRTDKIGLKHLGDKLLLKPCPRCGDTIIGDKTLKINGKIHCEKCSGDFKNQLIEEIKSIK